MHKINEVPKKVVGKSHLLFCQKVEKATFLKFFSIVFAEKAKMKNVSGFWFFVSGSCSRYEPSAVCSLLFVVCCSSSQHQAIGRFSLLVFSFSLLLCCLLCFALSVARSALSKKSEDLRPRFLQ